MSQQDDLFPESTPGTVTYIVIFAFNYNYFAMYTTRMFAVSG